jgi:hypothetical protein
LSGVENKDELEMILATDSFNNAGFAEYDNAEFISSMVDEGFEILQK